MTKKKIPHELSCATAKRRIQREAARRAKEYGLTAGWDGYSWRGQRKGATIHADIEDGAVEVRVALSWWIPYPESRVAAQIARELRAALA